MKILLAIIAAVVGMSFATTQTAEAGGKGGYKHMKYTKKYIVKINAGKGWKVVYRGSNWAYAKSRANYYRAHGCQVIFY